MNTMIQVKTRRQLRSRGTRRRSSGMSQGNVKLNTEAASAILTPIYASMPTTKATGEHNLTYGEIEWSMLKLIVEHTKQWPSQSPGRFYDLGCGRGKAVLYMALAGPFDLSVGVEVLPERILLAQHALTQLKASIPSAGSKIRLYEASFLNPAFKYKDARVVYLSNIYFDSETQAAIFAKLNIEMPKGSLVFCSKEPAIMPGAFEKVEVPQSSEIHILRHL